ncbi:MAG: hypothetical protein WCE65_08340 [Methanoregula sp.]|uniref:hypothetical protein n=1 Tax=Methanoregula sp. TaxID=2052170 RepID=UPI003BB08272
MTESKKSDSQKLIELQIYQISVTSLLSFAAFLYLALPVPDPIRVILAFFFAATFAIGVDKLLNQIYNKPDE